MTPDIFSLKFKLLASESRLYPLHQISEPDPSTTTPKHSCAPAAGVGEEPGEAGVKNLQSARGGVTKFFKGLTARWQTRINSKL